MPDEQFVAVQFNVFRGVPIWTIPSAVLVPPTNGGEYAVIFQLTDSSDGEFPANPINWLISQPPQFSISGGGNQARIQLVNDNPGPYKPSFPFEISVTFDGITYSSQDPEVVLDPPG